jgi:hypothetical protein
MGVCAPSQTHRHTARQTDRGKEREVQKYVRVQSPSQAAAERNQHESQHSSSTHIFSKKRPISTFHTFSQRLGRRASKRESTYRFAVVRAVLRSEPSQSALDQPARNAVLGPNVQRRGSSSDRKAPFSSTLALARSADIVADGRRRPRWGLAM